MIEQKHKLNAYRDQAKGIVNNHICLQITHYNYTPVYIYS